MHWHWRYLLPALRFLFCLISSIGNLTYISTAVFHNYFCCVVVSLLPLNRILLSRGVGGLVHPIICTYYLDCVVYDKSSKPK